MDNRNIINMLLESDSNKAMRQYLYTHYLDDKTIGRLNQVSRKFRLHGNDYEMWKMRMRKLLPDMDFTTHAITTPEIITIYRKVLGLQELYAFCMEYMIVMFFVDAHAVQEERIEALVKAIENHTWSPKSERQLDAMAAGFNADKQKYTIMKYVAAKLFQESSFNSLTPGAHKVDITIPGTNAQPETEEKQPVDMEYFKQITPMGLVRPSDIFQEHSEIIEADPQQAPNLTATIMLSAIINLAPGFLIARNHTIPIIALLIALHDAHPQLLESYFHTANDTALIGEQLFLMALGSKDLSCKIKLKNFTGPPAPELIAWMISIDASCTKRSEINRIEPYLFVGLATHYKLYYTPLFLTLESMHNIASTVTDNEKATRYLMQLCSVAKKLLDHGAKWEDAAVHKVGEHLQTPRTLANHIMQSISETESCEQKLTLRNLIQTLLTYQPKIEIAVEPELKRPKMN